MIGSYLIQLLSSANSKKSNEHLNNCNMSSIICSGNAQLADKESHLNNEVKWLNNQNHDKYNNFGAVLYRESERNLFEQDYQTDYNNNTQINDHLNLKTIELINNPKYLNTLCDRNDIKNSKILLACSIKSSEDNQSIWMPPYTYEDTLKRVCYSIIIDGVIDNIDSLLHLNGFLDWLSTNRPEMLIIDNSNLSEYFFLWLVKSIQENGGDVLHGLYKGLTSLSCNIIGGQFNFFFSDGTGVFTYSNIDNVSEQQKLVSYKITRNEHNIFNYTLRNYYNLDDTEWVVTKPRRLYYFPILGAMQSCYDLSYNQKNNNSHIKANYCVSLSSLIFSRI